MEVSKEEAPVDPLWATTKRVCWTTVGMCGLAAVGVSVPPPRRRRRGWDEAGTPAGTNHTVQEREFESSCGLPCTHVPAGCTGRVDQWSPNIIACVRGARFGAIVGRACRESSLDRAGIGLGCAWCERFKAIICCR